MEKVLCDLVRLFPKSFRERFGAEMEQVIAHGYRRSRATGRACAVGYALRTGIGITVNAFLTWGELALRENKTTSLDLRSARRSLLRTPSYAAVMILVVAVVVSIAVVVAAYCLGTLFRDPAYRDPARLVFVWGSNVVSGQRRDVVSGPNFLDLREAGRTVESLAAIHGSSAVALRDGRPWILATLDVSVDFLGVLGVVPALGQDFSDVHRDSTGPDAVIVSHRFWKDDLDGDPNVIGATIPLDGRAHSIVGVLPSDFEFLAPFPLLRPLGEDVLHQEDRTYHNYWMVGRLERGAAPSDATRELSAVLARIAKDDDPRLLGWSVLVEPMLGVSLEAVRPLLLTLGAAVLLVAIAASLNLATLSLVRTFGRSREIFTRSVLGAGRRGPVRIVLLETGVLCGLGTWLGLGGGVGLVDALGGVVPAYVPIPGSAANVRVVHAELDTFVVGAAVAVAVAMWVLVVLPALLHTHALTAAPSEYCRVHEHEDGRVEVRYKDKPLPCRVFFDKNPHVTQGAIVADKRLDAVLSQIRSNQQERDRKRLKSRRLTLRQKERIRAAMTRAEDSAHTDLIPEVS